MLSECESCPERDNCPAAGEMWYGTLQLHVMLEGTEEEISTLLYEAASKMRDLANPIFDSNPKVFHQHVDGAIRRVGLSDLLKSALLATEMEQMGIKQGEMIDLRKARKAEDN